MDQSVDLASGENQGISGTAKEDSQDQVYGVHQRPPLVSRLRKIPALILRGRSMARSAVPLVLKSL